MTFPWKRNVAEVRTIQVPVAGMDCVECTEHVQHAIAALPGVEAVDVLLASEKAIIRLDPTRVDMQEIRAAVKDAGYTVPDSNIAQAPARPYEIQSKKVARRLSLLLVFVFAAVLFIVVGGEWLGFFEALNARVPFILGVALVAVAGYPIFRNVVRATLRRQIISHTLMTLGVLAALAVGQWVTALVVVFFMRVGDYVENFTTERARRAVKDLTALAPRTARVESDGQETELPIAQVKVGDIVVVRPGEKIPVDGQVISGQATIDQAAITGESLPVEVAAGANVFAATIAELGSLHIRVAHVGADTTFGRVIRMVEEAEMQRADVQRFADKFSTYYLPIVLGIAALTLIIRRDPLATAAVLVVACSCSIALATPMAMLASIGAAAKRGLLIKGGKYLETLARADVLLIDKTGTLTLGKPRITDVVSLNGLGENDLLALAASAERYSEHPLARAVLAEARARELHLQEPLDFSAVPGRGVRALVNGARVAVGNRRMMEVEGEQFTQLEAQGKTLLLIGRNDALVGVLAASDTLRPEVPPALDAVRALGLRRIELLTGDNERVAGALAEQLGISYRANLLPEDKIRIVKEYQEAGHIVVMVGDGVNDAPALAQANVGAAMGAAGSDIAIEAAHIALMRDDWMLVPDMFRIARRTMGVVKTNLIFTGFYNVIGLSLAAFGFLPPVLAAAAQSLPDLGILGNSSRLIRQK